MEDEDEDDDEDPHRKVADIHNEMERRIREIANPVKKKHRHVPTKENSLNIDNRAMTTLKLLLNEKERIFHSGYLECDLEKLPLLGVKDILINNI